MKLTLEQAAQILGISAPLLRWIRHQPRAGVRRAKPATVACRRPEIPDHDGHALIECRAAAMKHPTRSERRSL
jgi:hypothetical protein